MTGTCPAPDEWTRKLDGEVTANRASIMDAHAARCPACRATIGELEQLVADIAHPVADDATDDEMADRVMRAIDRGAEVTPIRRPVRWLYPVAGAVAAAAAVFVFVVARGGGTDQSGATENGTFQARGGGEGADDPLRRNVGLTVSADGVALDQGARVSPRTRYSAAYRNLLDDGTAVYAMVFAIDAQHVVHWLYPAFVDPDTDPTGIRLRTTGVETPFDDGAILDEPASGTMHIVTLFATRPVHVSEIEGLPQTALELDALREHFGGMRIEDIEVSVSP